MWCVCVCVCDVCVYVLSVCVCARSNVTTWVSWRISAPSPKPATAWTSSSTSSTCCTTDRGSAGAWGDSSSNTRTCTHRFHIGDCVKLVLFCCYIIIQPQLHQLHHHHHLTHTDVFCCIVCVLLINVISDFWEILYFLDATPERTRLIKLELIFSKPSEFWFRLLSTLCRKSVYTCFSVNVSVLSWMQQEDNVYTD